MKCCVFVKGNVQVTLLYTIDFHHKRFVFTTMTIEDLLLTMPQTPEIAVAIEVVHTWSPNRYVKVLPVTGIPRICVCATRGTSKKKLTKSGNIRPYL